MDHRIMKVHSHPLSYVQPKAKKLNSLDQPGNTFVEQLKKSLEADATNLKISKHAQKRLNERNISIESTTWEKIEQKVKEANKKGVIESLVITNDAALVVSNKNNTVITAMDRKEASSQIFTNINGTILIDG